MVSSNNNKLCLLKLIFMLHKNINYLYLIVINYI